jgi:PAS domain S-box-containing protein
LLVDDLPANLLALEAALDGVGDRLVRAGSGEEALRALAERDFAVVLLDVRMPGLSGFETAERIRAADRTRHTPVIFLSAGESDEFPVVEAYRLGAVDYLVKPLVPDILRAKAAVFVDLHRTGARLREMERRERERADETERRFARFMDHLPGLAWIKDDGGRYLYANDAAERAFGTPRAALYGRTDHEVFPPGTAAAFRENDRRAAATPAGVRTVEALAHPDGTVHHSLVSKFPIPGPPGRPPLVGGVAIDITDRQRAEDAQRFLAEAGEVLSSSLDCEETLAAVARLVVPRLADWCSVYVTDPDGGLRQLAVVNADPARAAWARDLARRYPPDPAAPRGVGAVARTGEPELTPDVTDDVIAAAARDPDHLAQLRGLGLRSAVIAPLAARGRTFGAVVFAAAESGRRYAPDDLRLAVDLGRRAGLAVDNARLFGENREALRLLGLLVEAAGRLTGSLDPAAVRVAILDLSRRLVAADAHAIWQLDPGTGEWAIADAAGLSDRYVRDQGRIPGHIPMPDGPIVAEDAVAAAPLESRRAAYRAEGIASVLAAPLRLHGAVSGTLVFYYRARRRFDGATVRVAAALADLAGAALGTAELYEREAASRRRAEEADRRKDEFLATLAHELRNPLAPLRNAVAILRLGPPPAQVEKVVGVMERQLGHLVHLVDDLLDVARVTSGKITLRPVRLDLRDVIGAAVETARPAVDAARHDLAVRLPAGPLPVTGDRTRLAQVLTNLLTNAAKYTPDGGRIEVSAEPAGNDVLVRVADTGVGIPADMLPRVFEVFTQVGRSADRAQGGLGLGLALVRSLAGMHGGAAWAESPGPGLGSTFYLRLPLAPDPDPAAGGG